MNHPAPARCFQGDLVSDSIKFGGVTLDCPNAGELAAFYAVITGGEVTVPGDDWAMMTCPDGSDICFQAAQATHRPAGPMPPPRCRCTWTSTSMTWTQQRRGSLPPVPRNTTSSPTTTAVSTPIRPGTPSACPPWPPKPFGSKPDPPGVPAVS